MDLLGCEDGRFKLNIVKINSEEGVPTKAQFCGLFSVKAFVLIFCANVLLNVHKEI